MARKELEYGEDDFDEDDERFTSFKSKEKIEEYMKNRDRSKLLINF